MTKVELLALIKSVAYLDIESTTTEYDVALNHYIDAIISQASDYVGEDIDIEDTYDDVIRAIAKQIDYEWRNKRTLGMESVSAPDGSQSKYTIDEWLKSVEDVFNRRMTFEI